MERFMISFDDRLITGRGLNLLSIHPGFVVASREGFYWSTDERKGVHEILICLLDNFFQVLPVI